MLVNCAAPARIEGVAVLVWRHPVLGQSAIELHTAVKDLETVETVVFQKPAEDIAYQ